MLGLQHVQRLQAANAQEVQEDRDVVHALGQAGRPQMPAFPGVLLVLPQGLVHAHRHAQPGGLDHEAADGAGAREVVEHLDAEDQMATPALTFHQHFAVTQPEGFLEAKREVARVDRGLALGTGEVGELFPHPLVAVDGSYGVAAHQQLLRSGLTQRLQRQHAGSIGVERIHDRLLVEGGPCGHRGGQSWKRYVQPRRPTT